MKNFNELLKTETEFINERIDELLPKKAVFQDRIIEAMNYSVEAGGKRLRPMLVLESFRLCGGSNEALVYPFMAALECIHTYSLVHDDLPAMDNDDYRRGKLTTHKKYGEDFGVLAGDGLLNYAYELMLEAVVSCSSDADRQSCSKAAAIIARKAGIYGMVGGQSLDVWLTDKSMNAQELDFIFRLKTGALIEAAFMAGAVLAGAEDSIVEKIEKIGHYVGFAFQIKDDILDITSTQEVLGKPVLSDEKNHKTTYVSLYGMEKAQRDVDDMSNCAVGLVKELGNNGFLIDLIEMLINRDK
ncbi:MAG: polyprenyl synthetase family protein [Eubacteriales bacterium]|nr:polyprenyl synthetase family protein [Eubacteriales bacterium]